MLTAEGKMVDDIDPEVQGAKFDKDLQYLLNRIEPVEFDPSRHNEIVIFSTREHLHHRRLYPLVAARLCQLDVPCYFLFYHDQIARTFPDLTIKGVQVSNSLREQEFPYLFRSGQIGYPRFDWEVDIEEKVIKVSGIDDVNLFPIFEATLQKDYKRYNINYEDPEVIRKIQKGLFTADEVIRYCQLYMNFSALHDIGLRIVGWESNYLPNGLFHLFFETKKNRNQRLQYVDVGTQYAHYYGSREDFPYNIGSSNRTVRSNLSKWRSYGEVFEDYFDRVRSSKSLSQEIEQEMLSDLRNNILGTVDDDIDLAERVPDHLKNRMEEARAEDKNIFCIFSHQFYDIPIDDTGSFTDSMCEWFDRTVDVFQERDDILFLKPHPAETQMPKDSWKPDETLEEYIGDRVKGYDNLILLEPDSIESLALFPHLDCGLVWRSTVGVEMMALGIPMIVSGTPPWLEYLNPIRPETLSEYKDYIDHPEQVEIGPVDQTRAVVYLHWLKHYFHYFIPHIRNLDYEEMDPRKVRWDREHVDELLEGNCPNIDALIDELNIEGFHSDRSFEDKMTEPYENEALEDDVELK